MSRIALVSFRLGGTDGVSIEAAKWVAALRRLGHHVTTVAGAGVADRLVRGLAADATSAPNRARLHEALGDCDVVIVENLASLPLNVAARDVLYDVLEGRDAIFRHHDLAWQRAHLAHLEGPRDAPRWRHVTINELSRHELLARGITATTMYNSFDCDPPPGRRAFARDKLGVGPERLVAMPTRAIARKNVGGALELCARLGATLWLMGPAEDGYDDELSALLRDVRVEVRRMVPAGVTMDDAYAGADLVVMPSTWEGFGNPVLESVTHRRALALHPYPVAREIIDFGFEFFDLDDVAGIEAFLRAPDDDLLASNLDVARRHFNLADLPARLSRLLDGPLAGPDG
ncbi:MAG: glycosyltransferase family 4 protein [Acidobacteriota bacterium]|nr:glycosyltransferase family 4 protein [Acidobacteriota bacterium]MDE3145815.1 glycosyltransferase family 4 protein [Acidobacteriota bacterium]